MITVLSIKSINVLNGPTYKKSVLLLWAVLLASTSFGVYKNFTAIDTHTVHGKEIIQLRLNDTNGIECGQGISCPSFR